LAQASDCSRQSSGLACPISRAIGDTAALSAQANSATMQYRTPTLSAPKKPTAAIFPTSLTEILERLNFSAGQLN